MTINVGLGFPVGNDAPNEEADEHNSEGDGKGDDNPFLSFWRYGVVVVHVEVGILTGIESALVCGWDKLRPERGATAAAKYAVGKPVMGY